VCSTVVERLCPARSRVVSGGDAQKISSSSSSSSAKAITGCGKEQASRTEPDHAPTPRSSSELPTAAVQPAQLGAFSSGLDRPYIDCAHRRHLRHGSEAHPDFANELPAWHVLPTLAHSRIVRFLWPDGGPHALVALRSARRSVGPDGPRFASGMRIRGPSVVPRRFARRALGTQGLRVRNPTGAR
jgi:hypothetical protein